MSTSRFIRKVVSAYRDVPGHFVGYFYGASTGKAFWFEGQTRGEVQRAAQRCKFPDAKVVDMGEIAQFTDDELDHMHWIATAPWYVTNYMHVTAKSLIMLDQELKRRAYDPSRP